MNQVKRLVNLPEVGLYEYLLVARPDVSVSQKIIAEKEKFTKEYRPSGNNRSLPEITIASFSAREVMEETILRYMQRVCSQQQSFEVSLNNYSGIPADSVHLRIQYPQPFRKLIKEFDVINNYVVSCSCPPLRLNSNPHLNIATSLPEKIYLKAIMDYSQKTFHETFIVEELVLLRRSNQYDTSKTIHVFRLQPMAERFLENLSFN